MSDQLDEIFSDEENDELNDFLPEEEEEAALPGSYVTLQSSTGSPAYVPVGEDETTNGLPGVSLRTVLDRSGLTFGASNAYFVGAQQTDLDALVAPGAVITVIGVMKGGQA